MKALVLFSGGLDSTTCLGLAVSKYGAENVIALSSFYGQKHEKELKAAEQISQFYGVKWKTLNLENVFAGSGSALLSRAQNSIPHEEYAEQLSKTNGEPVTTYVPFRNGLFLAAATSVALSHGCEEIYYGAHADDAAGNAYPDCSEAFNEAIKSAIYLGSGNQVKVVAPFIGKTKKDVVAEGLKLNVPYELTWSCYEGGEKACGECGTCRDRLKAFRDNGVEDPIEYEER